MGVPLPGLSVAVYDAESARVAPQGEGEVVMALPYPQLMLGYWQDPDRTRDTRVTVDDAQWYRTGDNVAISTDAAPGTPGLLNGSNVSFNVAPRDPSAPEEPDAGHYARQPRPACTAA